jgi:glycosyltransferase involved in cell wall biosynthesis
MTGATEPLVSILMNCYNGEKYLRESIESVLAQSYQNWELIFWDNQSTDHSATIFKSFDDKRLKYFYATKHTLLYEARNYASEKSSGNFIAFLDVDDYWETNKLDEQMKVFTKDKNVAMVYSNYYFKNEIKHTNKILYKNKLPEGLILDKLLRKHIVGLLTMIINRNFLSKGEALFDSRLHNIGDFDIAVRISSKNKVACVQQPLATYRWHGNNETISTMDRQINELESWCKEMMRCPEISNNEGFDVLLNNTKYLKGMHFTMKGDLINAFKLFLRLSFGKEKLKLLISILIPLKIIKLLRT